MKEINKKKSTLLSHSNNCSKENLLKVDKTISSRKSTYVPSNKNYNPTDSSFKKRFSLVTDIGEINLLQETIKENNDKKLLQFNNLSQTNFFSHSTQNIDVKTTQIKVVARFRPINMVEDVISKKSEGKLCVDFVSKNCVSIGTIMNKNEFTLDSVFDCETAQKTLYKEVIEPTIDDILNGYNGTVFTYGQSGSGKTYTMFGDDIWDEEKKGVIPRSIDQIFNYINDEKNDSKYELTFSILEIYKENLNDLLNPNTKSQDIKIKEDPRKGIYVDNITMASIEDKDELYILLEEAENNRSVAETKLNKLSSRSHIVFMLGIKQILNDSSERHGTLNLVDLAGSEKVSKTGAIGETLEEAKKINFSLSCLGNVINCLASGRNSEFVPYRESKLTRLLKDSLGGNYKTTLIVTCSPHSYNIDETVSTLMFANRAKNVKNKIKMNLKKTAEEYERIICNLQLKLEVFKNRCISNNLTHQQSCTSKELLDEGNITFSPKSTTDPNTLIKIRDEEILKLKEEIENLKMENKNLLEENSQLKINFNFDYIIEKLEKSLKNNLKDIEKTNLNLKNTLMSVSKEGNLNLDENKVNSNGNKMLEKLKEITKEDFHLDINSKMKIINENYVEFLERMKSSEDYDNNINHNNFVNTISNSKSLLNDILIDFMDINNDLFKNCTNINEHNKNTLLEKSNYLNLKKSFLLSNSLCVFYEKVLMEMLLDWSLEMRVKLAQKEFLSESNKKFDKINENFSEYLLLLEEIKKIKPSISMKNISNNSFNLENLNSNIIEKLSDDKLDMNKRKFIRFIGKKLSNRVSGINLINNIITKKFEENKQDNKVESNFSAFINDLLSKEVKFTENSKYIKSYQDSNKILNEMNDETPRLVDFENDKKEAGDKISNENIQDCNDCPSFSEKDMNKIECNNNVNLKNSFIFKLPLPPSRQTNAYQEITHPFIKKSTTSLTNILKNIRKNNNFQVFFKINRTLYTASIISSNDIAINQCNQELKLLRKEKKLHTQFIIDLTNENVDLNKRMIESELSLKSYKDQTKDLFNKELENIRINYKLLKDLYLEEINHAKTIVQELSITIDDILLNNKLLQNKENNSSELIKQFYFEKKESIVKKIQRTRNLSLVAEAMITDGGTATKKLDYVFIDLKKQYNDHVNDENFNIIYGSGLDREIPTKCPLYKNLKYNLNGDNDYLTPEEY